MPRTTGVECVATWRSRVSLALMSTRITASLGSLRCAKPKHALCTCQQPRANFFSSMRIAYARRRGANARSRARRTMRHRLESARTCRTLLAHDTEKQGSARDHAVVARGIEGRSKQHRTSRRERRTLTESFRKKCIARLDHDDAFPQRTSAIAQKCANRDAIGCVHSCGRQWMQAVPNTRVTRSARRAAVA